MSAHTAYLSAIAAMRGVKARQRSKEYEKRLQATRAACKASLLDEIEQRLQKNADKLWKKS